MLVRFSGGRVFTPPDDSDSSSSWTGRGGQAPIVVLDLLGLL